jgi:uncharacterized OB-fold protein
MTERPLPPMNAWSEPFWQAAREGRLIIQHCHACDRNIFYPRLACPFCFADQPEWIEACGRGTVYSFSVVENNSPSAFLADMPFVIAIVRLEEGVQLMTNLVGCDPAMVRCEMPVEVVFERLTEEVTLPKFKPRA